jgi:hypothetical protein
MGKKKIESNFIFDFLSQRFKQANNRYNMQTQTPQTQNPSAPNTSAPISPLDILQQVDGLLKTHSIVVNDRENLAILFEKIVELCTQMPKTKLKAAIKAATQELKPTTTKPKGKSQPKTKAQPKDIMVGPDGAADAPVISDLPVAARGRGRPRKAEPIAPASAAADPNAETAEKKRRGRPKKDKTVTISSNDDEDALIEKMMADVASMQKDEDVAQPAAAAVADDDETDTDDEMSPLQPFSGELMRSVRSDSMSPVIHNSVAASVFEFEEVEADVAVNAAPSKGKKEPKAKEPKAKVTKAKEPKAKEPKAKEPKAKEPKAKVTKAKEPKAKAVASSVSESIVITSVASKVTNDPPLQENREINGMLCLTPNFPRTSFTYNGRTYLRTETDNVYDNMTHEMIGVWDHANHEIICAFDEDEEMFFSEEE